MKEAHYRINIIFLNIIWQYLRSEKDILMLVNAIIANTKGDGEKSSEDFL